MIHGIQLGADRQELAVAVGLTHDIAADVQASVERDLPSVGRMLVCRPSTGPSARSIAVGRHAFDMAEALTAQIRTERSSGSGATVHLFIAAPNAFTFFLGQRQAALGRVCLYEFDFDGDRNRSYQPALKLPVQTSGT